MGRRIGFGILLVLLGAGLLFLQAGGYTWNWAQLWPLLLVLLGVLDIIEHGWRGVRGGGGLFVLAGGFLLAFSLHLAPWPLRQAWPAGLIIIGVLSLFGDRPSLPWAIILVGGGAFLLAVTTGRVAGDWHRLWPVLLGLAGLAALVSRDEADRPEPRVPPAINPLSSSDGEAVQTDRLEVLARIRAGEISVDEGAAILERLKEERDKERR